MLGNIGLPELLLIFIAAFLVYGLTRLPEISRSLERSVSEFKKGLRNEDIK